MESATVNARLPVGASGLTCLIVAALAEYSAARPTQGIERQHAMRVEAAWVTLCRPIRLGFAGKSHFMLVDPSLETLAFGITARRKASAQTEWIEGHRVGRA